jgi:CheY-like chemotaxis protein
MNGFSRIVLVEDDANEAAVALAALSNTGCSNETFVVKDKDEALDFLHARAAFRQRAPGLPAVVVIGPSLDWCEASWLLSYIRRTDAICKVPVVVMHASDDAELVHNAYAGGANSVVRVHMDPVLDRQYYAALGRFWGATNEPPPSA